MIESELLSIRVFLVEVTLKNWSREIFIIHSVFVLKIQPQTYEIKDLKGEKIIIKFIVEQIINELLSRTRQSYQNTVKVVLDFSDYATKNKSELAKWIDTSDLAAKNILVL